jgi:hypothetical protein
VQKKKKKKKKEERNKIRRRNNGGSSSLSSCAHCALSLSLSLICTAVTAAICTWSSVHGRHCAHAKKTEKERKRKEKKTREKKMFDSDAASMV